MYSRMSCEATSGLIPIGAQPALLDAGASARGAQKFSLSWRV
jgi:hypothetical protein